MEHGSRESRKESSWAEATCCISCDCIWSIASHFCAIIKQMLLWQRPKLVVRFVFYGSIMDLLSLLKIIARNLSDALSCGLSRTYVHTHVIARMSRNWFKRNPDALIKHSLADWGSRICPFVAAFLLSLRGRIRIINCFQLWRGNRCQYQNFRRFQIRL